MERAAPPLLICGGHPSGGLPDPADLLAVHRAYRPPPIGAQNPALVALDLSRYQLLLTGPKTPPPQFPVRIAQTDAGLHGGGRALLVAIPLLGGVAPTRIEWSLYVLIMTHCRRGVGRAALHGLAKLRA
jgi:hypothetical protein